MFMEWVEGWGLSLEKEVVCGFDRGRVVLEWDARPNIV